MNRWKQLPSGVYTRVTLKGKVEVLTKQEYERYINSNWWYLMRFKYFKY